VTFETGIHEYLIAARQEGKSTMTVRQYGWNLQRMASWLAGHQVDRPDEVSRALLREWGAQLYDCWSPATIKQAVSAAKAFFGWCHDEGLVAEDVSKALKLPHVRQQAQRTLSIEEIQSLMNVCNTSALKGVRDLAIVSLLVDSGLRAGELCRLKAADVDLEAGLLVVLGKGGEYDHAHFSPITARRMRVWQDVRPDLANVNTLFLSVGGLTPYRPLTTRGLHLILKKLGDKAGVPGVSPHAFRRSFACIAIDAGASSRALQMWGRWGDIRMIERYTQKLEAAKLYHQYSPVAFIERTNGKPHQPPLFEL